jgi:hypothetical protein
MAAIEKPNRSQSVDLTDEEKEFLKIIYKEISEKSRYYDAHVWQIPSITIAVNAFLIGQSFAESLRAVTWVRTLVVLSASFFTFVLLIALVKHRLHQRAQDLNIRNIEGFFLKKKLKYFRPWYNFSNIEDIRKVEEVDHEKKLDPIIRTVGPLRAHRWLIFVMSLTVFTDIVILVGILARYW